jgi:hypothetical protein
VVLNVRPYFQKGSIIFAHFVKKGRVLSSSTPGIVCVSCHAVSLFCRKPARTICVLNPSVGDVLVSKDEVLILFVSH